MDICNWRICKYAFGRIGEFANVRWLDVRICKCANMQKCKCANGRINKWIGWAEVQFDTVPGQSGRLFAYDFVSAVRARR